MSTTYAGANLILASLLASGTKYLGLHTSAPTRDTPGVEVAKGGYVRQGVTFSAPANGEIVSTATVQFPAATEYWGTVRTFGVYTASSGGILLWYDVLTDPDGNESPKTISAGDIIQVAAGSLDLRIE